MYCIGIYREWSGHPPNCNFFGCKCDPDQPCCVPAIHCYDALCDPLEFPCDKKKYHGVEGNKVNFY